MKLHQMQAFQAVARLGTVTQAAVSLNISQPAISKTLKLLEEDLGLSLFDTVHGRLVPTPQALALLPEVGRILSQVHDLRRHAVDLRDGKRGVLRIASVPSGVVSLIEAAYGAFSQAAPGAMLDVVTARTSSVVDLVSSGEVEIGFCQLVGMEKGIASHAAIRGKVVCVLPIDHPLAGYDVLTPADLSEQRIISYSEAEPTGRRIARAFVQAGVQPFYAMQVAQTLPAINLVGQGFGIALVDSFFTPGIKNAQLPTLPPTYTGLAVVPFAPEIVIKAHVLTQGSAPLGYLAEVFLDAVLERVTAD